MDYVVLTVHGATLVDVSVFPIIYDFQPIYLQACEINQIIYL
jgi:hypothetical protein